MRINRKTWVIAVIVVIVLIGISFFLYFRYKNSASQRTPSVASQGASYIIPDVPYYNAINGIRFSITAAAIYSILQYWGDTSTDPIALSDTYPNSGSYTFDQIAAYFESKGLNAQQLPLKTIDDLRKYINQDAKTPLFVFQYPSLYIPLNSLGVFGRYARVVIGLDDTDQTVIVHDYWLGNNFGISYGDFLQLSPAFIAVSPKQQTNITRAPVVYPPISDNERNMLNANMTYYYNYYATSTSLFQNSSTVTLFLKAEFLDNPDFQNMPPVFKMLAYDNEGKLLLNLKDYDGALEAFTEAETYDHDLDKPSGTWPAVLYTTNGILGYPYYYLGLTYLAKSNMALTKQNLEEALSIASSSKIVQTALNLFNKR